MENSEKETPEKTEPQNDSEIDSLHKPHSFRRQLLISGSIILVLLIITSVTVLYGRGYRFLFQKGEPKVTKTGILHITSNPDGAQIYIDGHLTTASNNSINLTPGKYNIKVTKDGYNDWQKDIQIEKEVVENASVTLFPKSPTLQSISPLGIDSTVIDPSATKLAYKISSQSAKRNGIYVFDMTNRSFPVLAGQSNSTQIADDTTDLFSQANLTWSPDGKQILASISANLNQPTYYLLNSTTINNTPEDVTAILSTVLDTWQQQRTAKTTALIKSLKPAVQKYVKSNFKILAWSPDETKILYQASDSAQMPVFINPRRIGNNKLYERRDIQKNAVYVYDIQEDINYRLIDSTDPICQPISVDCEMPFTWFPDSDHLIYVHDKKIDLIESDGSNQMTIYAGPFVDHFVYPWPDGSKLVIITNLNNTTVPATLYTVGLK